MDQPRNDMTVRAAPRYGPFALLCIPYLLLVYRFWFLTDDAFITFRYAKNLAEGHGLRFNLGPQPPVEGYSNFLWVLVAAIFEALRWDLTIWMLLVSTACGVVLLWRVYDALIRRLEVSGPVAWLATLALGCFPPMALWATSGMETMPFALLIFLVFELLILRKGAPAGVAAGCCGLLLTLIRVEGVAWMAVLFLMALLARRPGSWRAFRPFAICLLIVGIGYAVYFVWRYHYYGSPWPNTLYAKATLDEQRLMRGVSYVVSFALNFLTALLVLPGSLRALFRKDKAVSLSVAAMAWAFPTYAVVVTGDWMAMGRFLVPSFAFAAILSAWLLDDLWRRGKTARWTAAAVTAACIVIALLPGWNVLLVPRSWLERFHFRLVGQETTTECESWGLHVLNTRLATTRGKALYSYVAQRRLHDQDASFVTGAIGANGYYSGLYIFDKFGLVTPEVGRRELDEEQELSRPAGHDKYVPTAYFLKDNPTIIVARIVRNRDAGVVASELEKYGRKQWSHTDEAILRERYTPDFARVPPTGDDDTPEYIFTLTRIDPGAPPAQAHGDFFARLRKLRVEGHLPLPQ